MTLLGIIIILSGISASSPMIISHPFLSPSLILPSLHSSPFPFHFLSIPLRAGMFQVNPRGDQGMGGRPVDIRDRVDVRNGKQQVLALADRMLH